MKKNPPHLVPLAFLPQAQLHSLIHNSSSSHPTMEGQEHGEWSFGVSASLLCSYFLLTHFSYFSKDFPQAAFPPGNMYVLQCGVPHGLQGTYLLQNGAVLQWNLCSGIWREGPLPLAPSSLTLMFTGLMSCVYFFSSLFTSIAGILPLLQHIFTEVLLPHIMRLMASAVSCMGSLWSWLEQIVSGMGKSLSSCQKKAPLQSPSTSTWTQTPTILTDFLSVACCPTFSRCNSTLFFGECWYTPGDCVLLKHRNMFVSTQKCYL